MVGFPHSEILGSKLIRSSPRLIAAYYVLHRLCTPRHPLDALKTLDRSHYLYPQHHQQRALLYACMPPSSVWFPCRSLKLLRDQKKNQLSRRYAVPPRGCRVKRDNKRSLYDVKISGSGPYRINTAKLCSFSRSILSGSWWSQTGSNRRHPACKAGALPAELRPLITFVFQRKWWAWEDLNLRPHAYQARALTN